MGIVLFLFLNLATYACPAQQHSTNTTSPNAEHRIKHRDEHKLEAERELEFKLKPKPKPETFESEAELEPEPKPKPELKPEPETTFESEAETTFVTGSTLGPREPRSLSANLMWLQKRVHQFIRKIKLC